MGWERNAEHQEHEHKMSAQGETGNYAVGDQVPTRQVCMVNDAYMAKDQIPVPVNGKTYYGCCQMCVKTLNEQETARMATDPNTGEKVDKTEAYIVLLNEDGAVGYFKTEENYLDYKENR
jgi:YHS domain-containing protein